LQIGVKNTFPDKTGYFPYLAVGYSGPEVSLQYFFRHLKGELPLAPKGGFRHHQPGHLEGQPVYAQVFVQGYLFPYARVAVNDAIFKPQDAPPYAELPVDGLYFPNPLAPVDNSYAFSA
jgi:hypothetical protein